MHERLIGRYLCEDFVDAETGRVLVSKDKMMTDEDADIIVTPASRRSRSALSSTVRPSTASAKSAMAPTWPTACLSR